MNTLVICFMAVLACAYAKPEGKVIGIVRQTNDVNPDGSYQWSIETENGIVAQEQGVVRESPNSKEPVNVVQGGFAYTAPDNTPVQYKYIADENGFQPESNVLPTAPPTPPAILRALEWILAHPQKDEPSRRP